MYDLTVNKQAECFDKPTIKGLTVSEMAKLLLYETLFDKLQPDSGEVELQLLCIETKSLALSSETDNLVTEIKKLQEKFDLLSFQF